MVKNFWLLKLRLQSFEPFFSKKHFSPLASPVATVLWSKIHLSQTLRPVPTIYWCSLSGAFEKKIIKSCSVIFRKFLRNNILIDCVIKRHLFSRCFRGSSSEKCYVVLRKTSSMRFSHRFTKGFHGTVSDISIEWYSKFLPQKKQHRCKEKVFFFVILYLYFFQCYP